MMLPIGLTQAGSFSPSTSSILAWLYLVTIGSVVGYTAYTWLLANAPLGLVSTYAYVNPVVAILLGVLFRNEQITTRILIGAAIVVSAVAVVVRQEPPVGDAARGGRRARAGYRPTMSSSRTGARAEVAAGRVAQRRDDRGGRDDRRRLADALDAVGRVRVGILDQHRLDRRHVERGRDQVVGEARVRDQPVARLDLLHHGEAEALRDPALDLALDRLPVDRPADLLRGADPDDAGEAEIDVDLRDDAHRRDRERDVGALAGHLAGLGIERRRRPGGGRRARRRPRRRRASRARRARRGTRRGRRRRPCRSGGRPRSSRPSRPSRSTAARDGRRRSRARCAPPAGSRSRRPDRPRPRRSGPPPSRRRAAARARRSSRRSPPRSRCS